MDGFENGIGDGRTDARLKRETSKRVDLPIPEFKT